MFRVPILTLVLFAGCGAERIPLSTENALVAKCSFGEGNESIEPDDPFVYAYEGAQQDFFAFSSVARVSEALRDRTTSHEVDLVEPAVLGSRRIDWSNGSIGLGVPDGEVQTVIGMLEGSQTAYPRCVFWPR